MIAACEGTCSDAEGRDRVVEVRRYTLTPRRRRPDSADRPEDTVLLCSWCAPEWDTDFHEDPPDD